MYDDPKAQRCDKEDGSWEGRLTLLSSGRWPFSEAPTADFKAVCRPAFFLCVVVSRPSLRIHRPVRL